METTVYSSQQISEIMDQLADQILKAYGDLKDVALVGIRTGGAFVAARLRSRFEKALDRQLPFGILDINLYRDDFDLGDRQPEVRESSIDFNVRGKIILLVDDVLFTGRTVRSALEALNDYGRPAAVRLVALVDRGHRELPIQPDFTGATIETSRWERIKVSFEEQGLQDSIQRIELPQ